MSLECPLTMQYKFFSKTTNGEVPENPDLPPGSKQMVNLVEPDRAACQKKQLGSHPTDEWYGQFSTCIGDPFNCGGKNFKNMHSP